MGIPILTVNKVAMVLLVFLLLLNKDNSEDLLAVLEILLLILQDNHHVLPNHLLHLLSAVLLDNLLHPQVVHGPVGHYGPTPGGPQGPAGRPPQQPYGQNASRPYGQGPPGGQYRDVEDGEESPL